MSSGGGFTCRRCGREVAGDAPGTRHRNHCPYCLWSVHLDDHPGDRHAGCGAPMEPIAIAVRKGGEWVLIHRCQECVELHANRIAADDDAVALVALAVRPLAQLAALLERLRDLG